MKDIKKEFRYLSEENGLSAYLSENPDSVLNAVNITSGSEKYSIVNCDIAHLSHVLEPSDQTDLIRLNSRFTTNQEVIMDNEIEQHGMELQTIIITTRLVDLSLSVNATMKNYNIKNLYDLADKMAGAYIALEELKKMWQVDDETIDELIDKKMGEIKKKMEE